MATQSKSMKPKPSSYQLAKAQASKLDLKSRAKLAEWLIQSLDEASPADVQKVWADEAMRRREAMNSGRDAGFAADRVLKEARARL